MTSHKFSHGVIHYGDCLELMQEIPDDSIDLVLADLPYGNVECDWDVKIPFDLLWKEYKRVLKDLRSVVLFGTQPFITDMINSNREWFKYDLIWDKGNPGDVFNAKLRPLRQHETICVFSNGKTANCNKRNMLYNPIGIKLNMRKPKKDNKRSQPWGGDRPSLVKVYKRQFTNYPRSVLHYMKVMHNTFHPTQKPVKLFEYLIRTYTNKGDTVLDNVIGSGTTGVAAYNTGRRFIGMEKDEEIYSTAVNRIDNETRQLKLFENLAN